MVSVSLALKLVELLKKHANGNRIAWLGHDSFSSRKITKAYREVLGIQMSSNYAKTFEEWKSLLLKLQTESDMILHSGTITGVQGWEPIEAERFVMENIKIPIGTVGRIMCCAMVGVVKNPAEMGAWSLNTALEILNGKKPSDIPITRNKEGTITINAALSEKLDILYDSRVLKNAKLYQRDQ